MVSITLKMKVLLIVIILLDLPSLKGQQTIKEFEHILLRFPFPPFYNNYMKSCCKLYPGGCYKLLDSTGYTCDLLKGRVTKTEDDGWIEFQISNVQFVDAGYYRCIVLGTENHIYRDYFVEVSGHTSQSQPPTMTTIKALDSTTNLPESTKPVLAQDRSSSSRVQWSLSLCLAVIVSITATILITSVIGVVFCKVKQKQPDKYEETQHDSLKEEALDSAGIVYTTVDFRAHQKQTEMYANLRTHKTMAKASDTAWRAEHDGMVEYSTLAIH